MVIWVWEADIWNAFELFTDAETSSLGRELIRCIFHYTMYLSSSPKMYECTLYTGSLDYQSKYVHTCSAWVFIYICRKCLNFKVLLYGVFICLFTVITFFALWPQYLLGLLLVLHLPLLRNLDNDNIDDVFWV